MESSNRNAGERINGLKYDMQALMANLQNTIQSMGAEITILKKVVPKFPFTVSDAPSKVCVPEPKGFGGARNEKELENFWWDMEQFFKAAHVPDGEKVSITSMYLSSDVKLWWRTRMGNDAVSRRP